MKAALTAFVAIAVIAFGANLVLQNLGFSSEDTASGPSVRLDD